MLAAHLDNASDLASRLAATIDATVAWIDEQLGISNLSLCDLGCGLGLYTSRFAQRGARTTGVDFSEDAIEYARSQHDSADYLTDDLPHGVDVITLIYCDLCVLAPADRHHPPALPELGQPGAWASMIVNGARRNAALKRNSDPLAL